MTKPQKPLSERACAACGGGLDHPRKVYCAPCGSERLRVLSNARRRRVRAEKRAFALKKLMFLWNDLRRRGGYVRH